MSRRRLGRLADRVAVVTGGSAGLGRATCLLLAEAGARVVVVGRDAARLEETRVAVVARAGGDEDRALALALDVTSATDMAAMAERTLARWGRIDALVHSAGVLRASGLGLVPTHEAPIEEWRRVLAINLRGTFLANRAVLPTMIAQQSGDIVNLSSKSGRRGLAYDAPYCASKFALMGLTEVLAAESEPHGVRVHALMPGTFETGIWAQVGSLGKPEGLPPAERVAEAVLLLLSLPGDVSLGAPTVEPSRGDGESGWRGGGGALQRPPGNVLTDGWTSAARALPPRQAP